MVNFLTDQIVQLVMVGGELLPVQQGYITQLLVLELVLYVVVLVYIATVLPVFVCPTEVSAQTVVYVPVVV